MRFGRFLLALASLAVAGFGCRAEVPAADAPASFGDPRAHSDGRPDTADDLGDTGDSGGTAGVDVCEGSVLATIQAGIDAAPDGAVVSLCPGDYAEDVLVDGKAVTIMGAGSLPDDVTWQPVAGPLATVTNGGSLALEWLALAGDETDSPDVYSDDARAISAKSVHFASGQISIVAWSLGAENLEMSVEQSLVEAPLLVWLGVAQQGEVVVRQNVVTGGLGVTTDEGYYTGRGPVTLLVSNNLVIDSAIGVGTSGTGTTTSEFRYNTVARSSVGLSLRAGNGETTAPDCPEWEVTDNIFYESDSSRALWSAWWLGTASVESAQLDEESPSSLAGNVMWNLEREFFASVTYFSLPDYQSYESTWTVTDTGSSADWLDSSILSDPEFNSGDAGSWVPDPAGAAAGSGAFAGPDGDWWREFVWPLP